MNQYIYTAACAFVGAFGFARHDGQGWQQAAWLAIGVTCATLTAHRVLHAMNDPLPTDSDGPQ